jgi:HJR/Mrr/RecB family endonuclease
MLTPQSGDGGIDVVALRGSQGELIQCKTSSRPGDHLGWDAIKDVVAGEAAYRANFPGVNFHRVCATNQGFNDKAWEQAGLNHVRLVDKAALGTLLVDQEVFLDDVERVLWADRPELSRLDDEPTV